MNTTKCTHWMNQWQSGSVIGSLTKFSRVNRNLRSAWMTACVHFLPKIRVYISGLLQLLHNGLDFMRTFTNDWEQRTWNCWSLSLCPTLWDPMDCVAHQALLSMGFSRQEYCSGLPFSSAGDLANPGIEPRSSALQANS